MLHKFINKITGIFSLFLSCFLFASCGGYDEQDATIIAYLKINDLLENKYSENAGEEISNALAQELLTSDNYFETLMQIKAFEKQIDNISQEDIEAEITETLWDYVANCYTATTIPSKAQNTETGTYYSISELKAMYPEYKEVELEDFIPMTLISIVNKEELFDTVIGGDDINLKTKYMLQSYIKQNKNADTEETSCEDDR